MQLDFQYRKKVSQLIREHLPDTQYHVFVFGSRAAGRAKDFSDIDIGIEGPQPVDKEILYKVKIALAESDLPFFVDVVDFSTAEKKFTEIAKQQRETL